MEVILGKYSSAPFLATELLRFSPMADQPTQMAASSSGSAGRTPLPRPSLLFEQRDQLDTHDLRPRNSGLAIA